MTDSKLEAAQTAYQALCAQAKSLMLASVTPEGEPHASYAPFYRDEQGKLYVYLSEMSKHCKNLLTTPKVSCMFIEDEDGAAQIFARTRATFDCDVSEIERGTPAFDDLLKELQLRFGEIVASLKQMADFHLFCLTPHDGRFVKGFAAAYTLGGEGLNELSHIGGGGTSGGHRRVKDEALTEDVCQRMVKHMNEEHADAVLHYAQHHGGLTVAYKAHLDHLDAQSMRLTVELPECQQTLILPFEPELTNSSDAHDRLVSMAKEGN